jgi:hypothetical protein
MWIAVCRDKVCQWHRAAPTQTCADLYAQWHRDRVGSWTHRVLVVAIPDETPPHSRQQSCRARVGGYAHVADDL